MIIFRLEFSATFFLIRSQNRALPTIPSNTVMPFTPHCLSFYVIPVTSSNPRNGHPGLLHFRGEMITEILHKIHPNESHNIIKYPQYKVTLICIAPLFTRTSPSFTSLQNKVTSQKSHQFTPYAYTSHHFTYLGSIPT